MKVVKLDGDPPIHPPLAVEKVASDQVVCDQAAAPIRERSNSTAEMDESHGLLQKRLLSEPFSLISGIPDLSVQLVFPMMEFLQSGLFGICESRLHHQLGESIVGSEVVLHETFLSILQEVAWILMERPTRTYNTEARNCYMFEATRDVVLLAHLKSCIE